MLQFNCHRSSGTFLPIPLLVTLFIFYASIVLGQERFFDDFSNGLSGWEVTGDEAIRIIDSGDPSHNEVMVLTPNNKVRALIKASEKWGPVQIEADVLFPDDKSNYLGVIYHFRENDQRTDFGSIYLKGNSSYLRVNPWRDNNASRLLYEEYKTRLSGDAAIKIDNWHHVKIEVLNENCHFYVDDMKTPRLTFDLYEGRQGQVGFKPRIVGWPVWLDNVRVKSISQLSYSGEKIPKVDYQPDELLTDWEVIGPLQKHSDAVEYKGSSDKVEAEGNMWQDFPTDARGAVITGKVIAFSGGKSVAYFRTQIYSETDKTVNLHISTVDELALWVNDAYYGFIYRDGYISLPENDWNAWYDFWKNPDHEGTEIDVDLKAGVNHLVFRVRGGQFASGGFFARIAE